VGVLSLVVVSVGTIPVALGGAVLFRVPAYFGWAATVGFILFMYAVVYSLLSYFLFLSVDVRPGRIVFRAPFRSIIIQPPEVVRIELEPPVRSLSMEMPWWKPWSKLTIHRKGSRPIDASAMPDGLKLRIANALRPDEFPLPKE